MARSVSDCGVIFSWSEPAISASWRSRPRRCSRRDVTFIRVAIGLVFALAAWSPTAMAQSDDDKARRTAEIELVAATIWRAVMARDVETLLSYARPDARDETRRRLTKRDGDLACALFDTECLQRQLPVSERGRISVADFFKQHPSARLRVQYLGMMMFGLESPLDLAMVTWVVPGSDADRNFPAHDLSRFDDHVNTCLIHTTTTGWRFHSRVGVFFCATGLFRDTGAR